MKRLLLLTWFFISPPVFAEHSLLIQQSATGLSTSATNYFNASGSGLVTATEADVQTVVPVAGTITGLRVALSGSPQNGGGTQTYTFAVMVNGVASGVTCAISETATTCSDTTNLKAVVAGDLIDIRCVPSGTPTARDQTTCIDFDSENGGGNDPSTALLGGSDTTTLSSVTTNYLPLHARDTPTTTESNIQTLLASAGTIKNLYIQLDVAPDLGAGVQSYAFTVNKNGTGTALTCTISETATTCSDTTNEVSVAAGDLLSLACVPTLAPTAPKVGTGMVFVPSQRGTFIFAIAGSDTLNGAATEYTRLNYGASTYNATETARDTVTNGFTIQTIYVKLSVAPQNGAGTQSYTFQFRDDAGNSGPSCAVSEDNTTCNGSTNGTVAAASLCDTRIVPANTPVSTPTAQIGYLALIAPRKRFVVD